MPDAVYDVKTLSPFSPPSAATAVLILEDGSIFYGSDFNYFADAQVRFEIPCPFPCASDFAINTNKRKILKIFGTMFNSSKL